MSLTASDKTYIQDTIVAAIEALALPRFDEINERFKQVDERFDRLERKFDNLDSRVALLECQMVEVLKRFDRLAMI